MAERDGARLDDDVQVEVKGPDPEVWGEPEEREGYFDPIRDGLAIDEVANEGEEDEVKGPGSQWERDEEGEYVNR